MGAAVDHILPSTTAPTRAAAALAAFQTEQCARQTVVQRVGRVVLAGQLAAQAAAERAQRTVSPTVSVLGASMPGLFPTLSGIICT